MSAKSSVLLNKKKEDFPSFDISDFKGKYDEDKNDWFNIRPLPFIPGVQPEIPLNGTTSIYGRRRSGKSELLKWLIDGSVKPDIPWWWVFSKTKHNSFWSANVPDRYIIGEFDGSWLNRIKERQVRALDAYTSGKIENPRAGIIIDDYNGKDIRYNSDLEDFYYTGRHFAVPTFFNAQYLKLTPPAIRSNTELAIVFNTDYKDSIDDYRKDFAGKLPTDEWLNMFREKCEKVKHGFLAIVTDAPYEKKFYYGKADVLPINENHIFGSREFWKGSEKQLRSIADGSMQIKYDMLAKLGKPLEEEDEEINS